MTDAAVMTESALQAADAHMLSPTVSDEMEWNLYFMEQVTYFDLVTYIYYSNWFSRNPSMYNILGNYY